MSHHCFQLFRRGFSCVAQIDLVVHALIGDVQHIALLIHETMHSLPQAFLLSTIETLPKSIAALIQMAVLYIDYMGIYLLNGWLPVEKIGMFTLIFLAAFAVIWLIIYTSIRMKVNRINQKMRA